MTKVTIDLNEDEDKQLKHILIEKNIVSKARFIEQIVKEFLRQETEKKLME